jgi:transcription-repair coupling factor (superfamily II helicase)
MPITELNDIVRALAAREPVEELARSLRNTSARLHAAPLIAAGRVPLVAALASLIERPLLYLVHSGDAALRARDDLAQWLGQERVLLFPAADALPYEHMSPGPDVLAARLRVLRVLSSEFSVLSSSSEDDGDESKEDGNSKLKTQNSKLVIVAPVKALTQPTLSPEELAHGTVRLVRGQELSPDDLVAQLLELGYRMAPTVEEPGELNRRGGIVDVFPPGDDMPLRIEFFGDEVDSLRRFDPVTQRSEAQVREVEIGPPHEFPLWRREEALERLRRVDVSALRREALDEWLAALRRLELGERFEGRALFASFFSNAEGGRLNAEGNTSDHNGVVEQHERTRADRSAFSVQRSALFSHMPPGALLVLNEATILAQHAADLDQQAENRRAQQVEMGELPRSFPRPYMRWDELMPQAAHGALLNLSNNEVIAGSHRVAGFDQPFAGFPLPETLFRPADLFGGQLRGVIDDIVARLAAGEQVTVITAQAARMQELVDERLNAEGETLNAEEGTLNHDDGVEEHERARADRSAFSVQRSAFSAIHAFIDEGFRSPALNLTVYTDTEIFGFRNRRLTSDKRRKRDRSAEERAAFLRGLKPGDYVVHIEHGIAQYDGLVHRTVGGVQRDYLNLRYAGGDKLYVPVDQIDRVSRYIGAGDAVPQLTRLGTQDWERAKRKARQAVQDLADELIRLYAERQLSQGFAFSPDTEWQRELEAAFPYAETPDQLRAIADTKADMEAPHPMDRLVCGDVGFGKTEVALRAAFKAVQDGKQVAILVPTTVLAQQHYDTFTRRMAAFPVKVELISRFRSAREQSDILQRLARGEVDILVGTHRLLSKDIVFKDLGLLVVDEEQRFGVRHKERIKQLRANVDVLTLTATPIPRTLHMALAGIRDLSVIDTPPEDRVPIKTYVLPYDENLVREAIMREIERDGQVYFVHNRVQSIYYVADKLRQLLPDAEIGVGHGQLEEHQLERVMLDFFSGKDDVLVSTTIIESGLDVPNANTIIIDDAVNYGLAQLYQLRGRVGRSAQRAYAYLFYKSDRPHTPEAQERLQAIQEATELGAGFRIAMRDLEIRGAGNLLGPEQSGHIAAVGFDLYSRLLEQAVKTLKSALVAANFQEPRTQNPEPRTQNRELAAQNGEQGGAVLGSPVLGSKRQQPQLKVDEKVLISPLVTLDLPLDAYLPLEYVPDDRVRLAVYQRMADAQTPRQVRELRQELRDRFGEPPEPAECLLTWLNIKALALAAGVGSVVTTDEEFIIRLPEGGVREREKLARRYAKTQSVKIGPQFVRLDRRTYNQNGDNAWIAAVTEVLETLAR